MYLLGFALVITKGGQSFSATRFHWSIILGYLISKRNDRYCQMNDRSYQVTDRSYLIQLHDKINPLQILMCVFLTHKIVLMKCLS